MIKFVIPVIFLIVSGMIFFGYTDPVYDEIQAQRSEEALFQNAIESSRELLAVRDALLETRNSFSQGDVDRLELLLPDHVDNVRLIREIDGIAARYGLEVRDIGIDVAGEGTEGNGSIGAATGVYGEANLSFSIEAPYKIFLAFLEDLERSLRLVDIEQISFAASEVDLYEYEIGIKTYWLK